MSGNLIADFLLWALAFVFSTTFHEASHAFVALRSGDPTAYHAGQVTMNPLPHIKREPFGMVIVPILVFFMSRGGWMVGWASAPFNPYWAQRYPKKAARMALAGPASNLLLVFLAAGLLKVGAVTGVFQFAEATSSVWDLIAQFLFILFTLNTALFVFNLIPLPPLDGAEVILLFFPEHKAEQVRQRLRVFGMFGILIAWLVFDRVFPIIWSFFVTLL